MIAQSMGPSIHSFIHSFLEEELPAQPRLNREDLRRQQKAGILLRGIKQSSSGSPFPVDGPTIEKARRCLRYKRTRGQEALPWPKNAEPDGGARSETEVRKV